MRTCCDYQRWGIYWCWTMMGAPSPVCEQVDLGYLIKTVGSSSSLISQVAQIGILAFHCAGFVVL